MKKNWIRYCERCGSKLEKKMYAPPQYNMKTGKPYFELVCPNYYKSFFEAIFDAHTKIDEEVL